MPNWTQKQKLTFLGYLLFLNVVVLGGLAYLLFSENFWRSPHPSTAAIILPTPKPTLMLFPLPTAQPTPSFSTLREQVPTFTPTLMFGIPALSAQDILGIGELAQQSTEQLNSSLNDSRSKPTSQLELSPTIPVQRTRQSPTIVRLQFTPTPTPLATPTLSPTKFPTPTATPIPLPTLTSSATATKTSQPTLTATTHPTRTPQPTSTASPTSTNTATPQSTPTTEPPNTQHPTPLAPTSTRLPTATSTQHPTPQVIAAVSSINREGTTLSIADLTLPNPLPVVGEAEVVSLSARSIALRWNPAPTTRPYRVYSDMGSGYGVYIYKAQVQTPTFVDETLRSGHTYRYRITQAKNGQEIVLSQAASTPLDRLSRTAASLPLQPQAAAIKVTPAPTALPADTILLGLLSDNRFIDDFGLLTIVGEVRNDSNLDVGETDIMITFYNATGAVIETSLGKTMLEVIPPGETSPFLITLPRPTGLVSHSLRATARPVTPKLKPQLVPVEVRRFEDDVGFFHIKGVIENEGNITSKRPKVAAIIYGRDGRVINVSFTTPAPPILAPGEQATYDIIFTYYPRYASQVVIPFEE